MKQYVLCKNDPNFPILFVCGDEPRFRTLDNDRARAKRFLTPEEALAYRREMRYELGGTDKYHVHELLPAGQLVPVD
jgi:hypothetical protein